MIVKNDVIISALIKEASIAINVAFTTHTCQTAQMLQHLKLSSTIALGRMLTAAGLMARSPLNPGPLSLQVVCNGRLGQVFVDVTDDGDLRGYVKQPALALAMPGDPIDVRCRIAPVVGQGQLSVIRLGERLEFAQSTTALTSGELDSDVQSFMEMSDQIASILICDVLFDDKEQVQYAGGVLIQAMPGHDPTVFNQLRATFKEDNLSRPLKDSIIHDDPLRLIHAISQDAQIVGVPENIGWKCRCSQTRVLGALKMIPPADLAEMIDQREPAIVHCDFCLKRYEIPTEEIEKVFLKTVTGSN
jgi:molecular chaperone Hsp33